MLTFYCLVDASTIFQLHVKEIDRSCMCSVCLFFIYTVRRILLLIQVEATTKTGAPKSIKQKLYHNGVNISLRRSFRFCLHVQCSCTRSRSTYIFSARLY